MRVDSLRNELNTINKDLACLLRRESISLSFQSGAADDDSLFLYGIVGGKDVGKTSLINRLAGAQISRDTDILDEGTRIAVGYSHVADELALKKRLAGDVNDRLRYVSHEQDNLRHVVLLDFPDFDSRFQTHREDMRRLVKHLQAILWVVTPRKYGDHEFLDQLQAVAQSNENYFVVLNKIDQLEQRADFDEVRSEVVSYISEECRKRKIPSPNWDRLFLVSAIEPGRYEFTQLRNRLIRSHSADEIAKAKIENLRFEFTKNIEGIRTTYAVAEKTENIERALDFIQRRVAEEFSDDYFETVRDRVLRMESLRRRISRRLFAYRVEHWPILSTLFYPLGGLISFFGSRIAFTEKDPEEYEGPGSLLRYDGQSAAGKIQSIRDDVETDFPEVAPDLGDVPEYPEWSERRFGELLDSYEQNVTEYLFEGISKPRFFRKTLVYLPLIWFPFLQPILQFLVSKDGEWFSFHTVEELSAQLITLLGAGSLLQAVVFLLVFYGLWLVLLYANGARRVLTIGEREFHEAWYQRFVPSVTDLLCRPLTNFRDRLAEQTSRLRHVEGRLETVLQSYRN